MTTITKERAQEIFLGNGPEPTASEERELARIALASLEAERVGCDACGGNGSVDIDHGEMGIEHIECPKCYSTPPAPEKAEPVAWLWSHRKHPSEVTLVRPEDDEKAEAAQWSGWSCQALYLVPPEPVSQETTDREMIKRLAVILSGSDAPGEIRSLTVTARSFVERCKTLANERDECRAAMLQGADGNSPVISDGWVACSERMPEGEQEVLIVNQWGGVEGGVVYVSESTFYKSSGFYDREECYHKYENVSHWMALPAAPQQEVKP